MSHSKNRTRSALVALGATATILLAGCSAPAVQVTTAPGELPQAYIDAGQITASTICDGAPFSFCDAGSTTAKGVFADIAAAWGDVLGVKVDPIGMAFDSILPSTASGRYDIVLAIGDTVERQAQFDFIDILHSSYAITVPAGNPKGVKEQLDLCGLIVASTTGSAEAQTVDALSTECTSKGKAAIESLQLGDLGSVYLSLSSGRADAAWGSDASSYTIEAQSPDLYKVAFEVPSDTVFAIAVPKSNPELRDAIAVAVAKIIENGKYLEVLDKWHLATQGLDELTINREPAKVPGT
ncbi:MAG: ABC transporter substrate-binding protein [Pseudolysinimonas sp.]